jgi:hypothetical protein
MFTGITRQVVISDETYHLLREVAQHHNKYLGELADEILREELCRTGLSRQPRLPPTYDVAAGCGRATVPTETGAAQQQRLSSRDATRLSILLHVSVTQARARVLREATRQLLERSQCLQRAWARLREVCEAQPHMRTLL